MKIYTHTFGCQMNVSDSEEMAQHLFQRGGSPVDSPDDADVILLNTCTVRQHAEDKALSFLGRLKPWKKNRSNRMIIVAGCAAERLSKTLRSRFPHVDLVIGAKSIDDFSKLVETYSLVNGFNWFTESEESFQTQDTRPAGQPFVLGHEQDSAFVTIMRGCNYSCSYCIVPSVRGREIYRPIQDILAEIQWKVQHGAKQVMLLGQTVNSYWYREEIRSDCHSRESGNDNERGKLYDFSELLQEVEKISGVERIQFMSPHPHYMSDKLIQTLSQSKKISSEIHLPVQSGSNAVLKRMNRNYTREEYLAIAAKLKNAVPDLHLGTDFIVGFPGETEHDFQQSLSLVDQVRFGTAYCFKYSPRKGTESAQWSDDVPPEVKEDRLQRLLEKVRPIPHPRGKLSDV
jgi:tRNA-2-methylthio-N6-dimethylallyladenosine synthase